MSARSHKGFTLIEVLVALVLAGVVTGISWLLLAGVSRTADEIQRPVISPVSEAVDVLRRDTDHLPRDSGAEDTPPLQLLEDGTLKLHTLHQHPESMPRRIQVRYYVENNTLIREQTHPLEEHTEARPLLSGIRNWRPRIPLGDDFSELWPLPGHPSLPARLEVTVSVENEPDYITDIYIPVSFSIRTATE